MKLNGLMELSYNDNGVSFDIKVEVNEKNQSNAVELLNVLSEYIDDTEKSKELDVCMENCKLLFDKIGNGFTDLINAKTAQLKDKKEKDAVPEKVETPIEQPEQEEIKMPELEFEQKTDVNIEIPVTIDVAQPEPTGNFDAGTLSDAEFPNPNYPQTETI